MYSSTGRADSFHQSSGLQWFPCSQCKLHQVLQRQVATIVALESDAFTTLINLLEFQQHLLMSYLVNVTYIITVENHLITAYSIYTIELK